MNKDEDLRVPYLETDRLILRGLTSEDMDFLFRHFSQDEINLYSASDNLKSMEETKDFYERYISPNPTRFRLGMVEKETKKMIGTLGFHRFSRQNSCAEAGCDLMKSHWGQGLMTEALISLISYGFGEMKLNRIEATTNSKNTRSIKLIDRIGFTKEGVLRKKYFYKGQYHDDIIYSLLREEWMKP